MQQRWIAKLMGYDFVVEFKKGKENVVVEVPFRKIGEPSMILTMISQPSWDQLVEIKALYELDSKLEELWQAHQVGNLSQP